MEGGSFGHVYYVMLRLLMSNSNIIRCFTVFIVAFVAHTNTLNNGFTFDDYHYIVESEFIKGWKDFFSVYTRDYLALPQEKLDLTRPFMPLSLTFDYSIWGLNPFGYHLSNVILHSLNSLAVYLLAGSILGAGASFAAALIFAVHPVHVETVASATFREDLLVTFFYITSLVFYIRFSSTSKKTYYFISFLAFFFALLSKEMAATLPLVLIIYDYFLSGKPFSWKRWLFYAPFWSLLALYLLFIYTIYSNIVVSPAIKGSLSAVLYTASKITGSCIKLLIIPVNLLADYNLHSSDSFLEPSVFFPAALIATLLFYLFKSRNKAFSFSAIFFFISLLPVINLIPTFNLLADRFVYLPSVPFCILAGLMISTYGKKISGKSLLDKLSLFIFVCMLVLFFLNTLSLSKVWKNDFTLWSNVLLKNPYSAKAYAAIGITHLKEERYDEALRMLIRSLELKPDYDKAHYNLGLIYKKKGFLDAATSEFKKAVEINSGYGKAYFMLGLALSKQRQYAESINAYEKAIKFMPDNAVLYNNLGNSYSARRSYKKALLQYETAISIDPSFADAHYNMGNAHFKAAHYNLAISSYEKSLAIDASNASAYFNLGNAFLAIGLTDEAVSAFETTLGVDPMHEGSKAMLARIRGWE